MIHYITYNFLSFFGFALFILPRNIVLYFGKIFGFLMYFLFPLRKKVAAKNLSIVFPYKNKNSINYLLKKTYQHYGLLLFEFIRQHQCKKIENLYSCDSETKKILNSKKGIIFMSAHLGNWEAIIPIISAHKKFTVIVRDQKNYGGDKFFKECRTFKNVTLLSKKGSKRTMLENLNKGHVLGLASDQNAHEQGTKLDFFGLEASFPKGAGHFYFNSDALLVVGFCILNKNLKYDFKLRKIKLEKNFEQKSDLIVEVNRIYSEILEKEILKYPEQYFWFHKKWKKEIY